VHSANNQLQADKFASEGFLVVMPDMFDNDPAPNSTTAVEEENISVIEQIKIGAVTAVKSFQIDMWLARHTAEKVMPVLLKVIDAVKTEYADAVASGGGLYGVGYCFGAKYILILGAEKQETVSVFRCLWSISYVITVVFPK
jgi:dienelactone hydrolase